MGSTRQFKIAARGCLVVTAFSVLNLFIGLLVNTMQSAVEEEKEQEMEDLRRLVRDETDIVDRNVLALMDEVKALRAEMRSATGFMPII